MQYMVLPSISLRFLRPWSEVEGRRAAVEAGQNFDRYFKDTLKKFC